MSLVIGDLKVKLPIIQGGMGVGVSLSNLAGTVSRLGGVGVISTAQIGFTEPGFKNNPLKENLKMIGEHIKRARKIAPQGVLGVNIMVATQNYSLYVKEAIKNGVDLIISGAGLPIELPQLTKDSKTKLVPIVSTLKAAKVLLKIWDRKSHTSPDAIIVEGPKAGGHLGFTKEELVSDPITKCDYDLEIKSIVELLKEYEERYYKKIPVIVAGGIRNKEDMEDVFSLGAKGIQVASKFIPTIECDANIKFKEAYLNIDEEDLTIIHSPVGMPGRSIKNNFIKRTFGGRIPIEKCFKCLSSCQPSTTPYCITQALINSAKGDIDNGILFCGMSVKNQKKIRRVKEVLNDFVEFQ